MYKGLFVKSFRQWRCQEGKCLLSFNGIRNLSVITSNVFQSGLCSSNTWWAMVHYFCSWVTRNHGNPKQSTGLLSIFLKAQPWQYFIILSVVCLESCFCVTCKSTHALGAVVQKVDNATQWTNLYPVDREISFPNTYPLDNDSSNG